MRTSGVEDGPGTGGTPERSADQLRFLMADLAGAVNHRWWRWISVPLSPGMLSIAGYRLGRACYLAFGSRWQVLYTLLAPLRLLFRPFGSGLEIHYLASIGPRMVILHANLGIVVSPHATIGSGLVLTGGNCIGGRPGIAAGGGLVMGDDVSLGANAVVLGPGVIGDRVVVGAGSVLIGDAPDGAVMVGSPARAASRRSPIGAATASDGSDRSLTDIE